MNKKRNELTIKDSGFVFAFVIFIPAIVSLVLAFIGESNKDFLKGENSYWYLALISQALILAVSLGYALKQKINFLAATGLKQKLHFWQIGLLLVLSVCLLCFTLPIQNGMIDLFTSWGVNIPTSNMPAIDNIWLLLMSCGLLALLPAFGEEFVYRGFIANGLRNPEKRFDVSAILISAALFAVMHQNPLQTLHPFILGVVMAVVYFATGSLWASIIVHFANNLLVLLLDYFVKGFSAFIMSNWWWVMAIALIGALSILYLFWKKADKSKVEVSAEKLQTRLVERNQALPYFTAAGLFCVVMWFFVLLG